LFIVFLCIVFKGLGKRIEDLLLTVEARDSKLMIESVIDWDPSNMPYQINLNINYIYLEKKYLKTKLNKYMLIIKIKI
jgi:hypothetical protein